MQESLQLFAFICELAFDVFLKKQMIERLADELRDANPPKKKKIIVSFSNITERQAFDAKQH